MLAPVSAEDEASLHGITELRQTMAGLTQRLDLTAPELVALLTRWQPYRIAGKVTEAELTREGFEPAARIPARPAPIARAAACRVPLALGEPDSSPALAYRRLAERLGGVTV